MSHTDTILRSLNSMHDASNRNVRAEHSAALHALDALLAEKKRLESILDDLCDWAQHVAAPEDDAIHSIVERAEEALKRAAR